MRKRGGREREQKDVRRGNSYASHMSRRPYVDIRDVSYLPLIAASVIQAEDKRARNKIRTGSTGLPYSSSMSHAGEPRKRDARPGSLFSSPAMCTLSEETVSSTFRGSKHAFSPFYYE